MWGLIRLWLAVAVVFILAWRYQRIKKQEADGIDHPLDVKLYYLLQKNRWLRRLAFKYSHTLKQLTESDEKKIKARTGMFFHRLGLVYIGGILLLWLLVGYWLYTLAFALLASFLLEAFVDYVIVKEHNQLLKGQVIFNELLRRRYYEQKTVEDALYEACQDLPEKEALFLSQAERLYTILIEKDIKKAMNDYHRVAPNKYLLMLLNLCYITVEFGDTDENGQSVFMNSLSYLTAELRIEIDKREKLNYALKSLNVIALIPLLAMSPLQRWAAFNFEPLDSFYRSSVGKSMEISLFVIVGLIFLALRKIQDLNLLVNREKDDEVKQQMVREKWHLRFLGFIGMLIILGGLHLYGQHQMLTVAAWRRPLVNTEKTNQLAFIEREKYFLKNAPKNIRDKTFEEYFNQHWETVKEELNLIEEQKGVYFEHLLDKKERLQKPILGLRDIGLSLLVAFLAGLWPKARYWLFKRIKKIEKEDEVAGFQSILLMLMNHTGMGIEEVMRWLSLFAFHYEEGFERCLNDYSYGVEQAFDHLRVYEESYFVSLINALEQAAEDLSLRQAFDDLIHEKSYYLEKRREINRRMIEKRINLGQAIGFLPAYALIILYLIVPMVVSSLKSLTLFYEQVS